MSAARGVESPPGLKVRGKHPRPGSWSDLTGSSWKKEPLTAPMLKQQTGDPLPYTYLSSILNRYCPALCCPVCRCEHIRPGALSINANKCSVILQVL